MIIEIKNLTKILKKYEVLSNINISLKSGKVYGLCGENGSGKTMLMRAICGLVLPTEGEVIIDGKIIGTQIDFPESVGILIENPAFINSMNAYRNLELLGEIRGIVDKEQIRYYLNKMYLDPDSRKRYRKFSLGMKQKLGIVAAFFEEPELIILDEPYNALDEKSVEALNSLIKESRERGALIIISSHNKELLEDISDEIIKMKDGKIEK